MNECPLAMPFDPTGIVLDRRRGLSQQLYQALRARVLDGRLGSGTRLPATRDLAAMLSLSRNSVVRAYDQLYAEGYIESRVGDGTYVSQLPELSTQLSTGLSQGYQQSYPHCCLLILKIYPVQGAPASLCSGLKQPSSTTQGWCAEGFSRRCAGVRFVSPSRSGPGCKRVSGEIPILHRSAMAIRRVNRNCANSSPPTCDAHVGCRVALNKL